MPSTEANENKPAGGTFCSHTFDAALVRSGALEIAPSCMCIYSTRFTPRRIGQNPYQALYFQLYLYSSRGFVPAKNTGAQADREHHTVLLRRRCRGGRGRDRHLPGSVQDALAGEFFLTPAGADTLGCPLHVDSNHTSISQSPRLP